MKKPFIVFHTISQVKSYLKRHSSANYYNSDGCGCCHSGNEILYDPTTRFIVNKNYGESRGSYYCTVHIIGKLKNKTKR